MLIGHHNLALREKIKAMSFEERKDFEQTTYYSMRKANDPSKYYYIIDKEWTALWISFTDEGTSIPGAITNDVLFDEDYKPKPGLSKGEHYFVLTETVWNFLYGIYGGGPVIKRGRKGFSIYDKDPSADEATEDLSSIKSEKSSEYRSRDGSDSEKKPIKNKYGTNLNKVDENEEYKDDKKKQLLPINANRPSRKLLTLNDGLVGLENYSAFCYLNSSLQCLLSITELRDYFINKKYEEISFRTKKKGFQFCEAMHRLFTDIWTTDDDSVRPKYIHNLVYKRFHWGVHHDCHEFLLYLLSNLQDEMISATKTSIKLENMSEQEAWSLYKENNNTIIDELFAGMYKSIVICEKCSYESVTYEPFFDLSLAIPTGASKTLEKCISKFLTAEKLELKQGYVCDKCKHRTKASKVLELAVLPKVMVIHLKRFSMHSDAKKVSCQVEYPVSMNMNKFLSQQTNEENKYSLSGLSVHMGCLDFGHYIAFSKRGSTWAKFDDTDVERASSKSAFGQEAYMLFYRRS